MRKIKNNRSKNYLEDLRNPLENWKCGYGYFWRR